MSGGVEGYFRPLDDQVAPVSDKDPKTTPRTFTINDGGHENLRPFNKRVHPRRTSKSPLPLLRRNRSGRALTRKNNECIWVVSRELLIHTVGEVSGEIREQPSGHVRECRTGSAVVVGQLRALRLLQDEVRHLSGRRGEVGERGQCVGPVGQRALAQLADCLQRQELSGKRFKGRELTVPIAQPLLMKSRPAEPSKAPLSEITTSRAVRRTSTRVDGSRNPTSSAIAIASSWLLGFGSFKSTMASETGHC